MIENTHILSEFASIKVGINLSRGSGGYPESEIYTLKDQEIDLTSPLQEEQCSTLKEATGYSVKEGDIIVNLGMRRCSIVSKVNDGKIIKNTFAKIELKDSCIAPWFLCYFINESQDFKENISTEVVSVIRPLSVSILGNIRISLPSIEKQKAIGVIYHSLSRIKYLNRTRNELLMKAMNKISTSK